MADLLLRDVDRDTHRELKRRAEVQGMSLQAYVTKLLSDHVARPSMDQWLEALSRLEPAAGSGAEAVAAARSDLP